MWASAPTLRVHFFCLPEKKRTKEKGTRMTCPANTAGYPALLIHSGALLNSHDRYAPRAQTKSAYSRYGLRCSATSYGTEVKNSGFVENNICFYTAKIIMEQLFSREFKNGRFIY